MDDILFGEVDEAHSKLVEYDKQQCILFGTTLDERKAAVREYRKMFYIKAVKYDGLAKALFFNQTDPSSMNNDYKDREYQIHTVLRGEVTMLRIALKNAEEHVARFHEVNPFPLDDFDDF